MQKHIASGLSKKYYSADPVFSRTISSSFFTRLKWKLLRKNRKRKKYYREKATDYLQVWIDYNEHILDMLGKIPAEIAMEGGGVDNHVGIHPSQVGDPAIQLCLG